jgi:hypothetical protein
MHNALAKIETLVSIILEDDFPKITRRIRNETLSEDISTINEAIAFKLNSRIVTMLK